MHKVESGHLVGVVLDKEADVEVNQEFDREVANVFDEQVVDKLDEDYFEEYIVQPTNSQGAVQKMLLHLIHKLAKLKV